MTSLNPSSTKKMNLILNSPAGFPSNQRTWVWDVTICNHGRTHRLTAKSQVISSEARKDKAAGADPGASLRRRRRTRGSQCAPGRACGGVGDPGCTAPRAASGSRRKARPGRRSPAPPRPPRPSARSTLRRGRRRLRGSYLPTPRRAPGDSTRRRSEA